MNIDIENRQSDVDLSDFIPIIEPIVSVVLEIEKTSCNHVSIQFLSDSTMRRYHKKFFNDGSSTDCMSFPLDTDTDLPIRCLGEILVCPQVARKHIQKNPDHGSIQSEIALYIIHGLFHLLGYDDIDEKDIKIMRKKEKQAIDTLVKKGILNTKITPSSPISN